MNINYKKVQNVLINNKKEKYIFFSQIVRFCTDKKKKIVQFERFFVVKMYVFFNMLWPP